ncbi:MAG: TM2 domain-containing protein [Sphingobacteriaceae bacterium]|nr:TM2 domain-containing protein [Sphingobacteriaceae bacterium]
MNQNLLFNLKGITAEEFSFVQQVMDGMTDQQAQRFVTFYSGKRQSPENILLFTLLGLFCLAGLQRFILGQYAMGALYLLTGGLCFIGTIVDLANYRHLATEYNQKIALECAQLVRF